MAEPIDFTTERQRRADELEPPKRVPGSIEDGPFVCTACSARFAARERQFRIGGDEMTWLPDAVLPPGWGLEDHWSLTPACRAALTRPLGTFGSPQAGRHCQGCHDGRARCNIHYDRCPGCE